MALATGRVAVDESGNVFAASTKQMVQLGVGVTVTYGQPLQLRINDPVPAGIWQLVSGNLQASLGGATIQEVMIEG